MLRREVDDAPAHLALQLLREHLADGRPAAQEDPLQVHRHHPVPAGLVHLGEAAGLADAGVVDHAVEAASTPSFLGDHPVAEKARMLRDAGQNVDIKGAGQTVIARMGLSERIDSLGTRERGQKFLDANGRVIAALPRGAFGCLTSDYEILRGDLASVMFEATR